MASADYSALPNNGMYSFKYHNEPTFYFNNSNGNLLGSVKSTLQGDSIYSASIPAYTGVRYIQVRSDDSQLDFNYVPDMYDYYVLTTVIFTDGTFVPDGARFMVYNGSYQRYPLTDISVYNHVDSDTDGFTLFGKLPDVGSMGDNTSFIGIEFTSTSYSIPSNLSAGTIRFDGLIIAVDRGTDTATALQQIIVRLDQINSNLTSGAEQIQDQLQQNWDDTFNPDPDQAEDQISGVGRDYVQQLEQGLGAVAYVDQVSMSVVNMISQANPGDPVVPWPGWNIRVGGKEYVVWESMEVNLAVVLDPFSGLITVVRFANVYLVWSALLKYFNKVLHEILRG